MTMAQQQYTAGMRVRVSQQIPRQSTTLTTSVEGTVRRFGQQKTGSWFAHSRDEKLWIDRLEIDLANVYDSGTDDGPDFTSANSDVTPHEPIDLVSEDGVHFLVPPLPLATLLIERIVRKADGIPLFVEELTKTVEVRKERGI